MRTDKIKHGFFKRLSLRESWIIFFVLGIIMLNYPFLHIFNKPVALLTWPLFIFYIMVGWAVSILVIFLFSRTIKTDTSPRTRPSDR